MHKVFFPMRAGGFFEGATAPSKKPMARSRYINTLKYKSIEIPDKKYMDKTIWIKKYMDACIHVFFYPYCFIHVFFIRNFNWFIFQCIYITTSGHRFFWGRCRALKKTSGPHWKKYLMHEGLLRLRAVGRFGGRWCAHQNDRLPLFEKIPYA